MAEDRLRPIPHVQAPQGPLVLAIMDGVGLGLKDGGDAVAQADTPFLDQCMQQPLFCKLSAHGVAVGMPSNSDMGNSEVGHNAMGAGRIIDQGAKRVAEAIASGECFEQKDWQQLLQHCISQRSTLHWLGLLSDGNVHSHIDHLFAMMHKAAAAGVQKMRCHILLDGRDVAKTSALQYVEQLEQTLAELQRTYPALDVCIASGGGRMRITMDRYQADWPMVERGWHTHVLGRGPKFASATQAIQHGREAQPGCSDQELPPFVIAHNEQPVGPMVDGDGLVLFNFRGDRMLEFVSAVESTTFRHFDRIQHPQLFLVGMTLYDGDTHAPKRYLVPPPHITGSMSEYLCGAGLAQWACSETQKFGHVTYFWNGNRSQPFSTTLERYEEIPSHPPPFDGRPEMAADGITQAAVQAIQEQRFAFLRLNYANGDMVGHTGNFAATVQAVACVDRNLRQLAQAVAAAGGTLVITADHGNAEDMVERDATTQKPLLDEHGQMIAKTSHSLNPVPFVVLPPASHRQAWQISNQVGDSQRGLANLAGTLLMLMGYQTPPHYLPSLISWNTHPH